MSKERSQLIEGLRAEIVGPAIAQVTPNGIDLKAGALIEPEGGFAGPLCWKPSANAPHQEVIYFQRETPASNYGAGALYMDAVAEAEGAESTLESVETELKDAGKNGDLNPVAEEEAGDDEEFVDAEDEEVKPTVAQDDDFEVTSPDVYRPSAMSITFCAKVTPGSKVVIRMPSSRRFFWQHADSEPFQVNGVYEPVPIVRTRDSKNVGRAWLRRPIADTAIDIEFADGEIIPGQKVSKPVNVADGNIPVRLEVSLYPRSYSRAGTPDRSLIITAVLRNVTKPGPNSTREESTARTLFQSYFEAHVVGGTLLPYPESRRQEEDMDDDEKSLDLLYSRSQTWAIGHGCAAAWDAEPGQKPEFIYADSMPAVELPSMTPDIKVSGKKIEVSMRSMLELDQSSLDKPSWVLLQSIIHGYREWIASCEKSAEQLQGYRKTTALRHIGACKSCAERMERGLGLLMKSDGMALKAFKLANLSMLLQQIASKAIKTRALSYDSKRKTATQLGVYTDPWSLYIARSEESASYGKWRAFQLAFLLMSLPGVSDPQDADREIVDLIWFPTGGGKTEAYLGVMAFMMFYQRLSGQSTGGTSAMMRYTLRMLTTQQFQRASSLICAMEFLRRDASRHGLGPIPGDPFTIGLWLGGSGSPNCVEAAKKALGRYANGKISGNPMVLTECPWCRSELGIPESHRSAKGKSADIPGVKPVGKSILLVCTDPRCEYGKEAHSTWLPVHVIDELIYNVRPTLVIATADKLAMIAHKPAAGALFGFDHVARPPRRIAPPPSLIIQDEMHLISGPLGTMYGLYETIFEKLCTDERDGKSSKPKIIASTATIRGADQQVASVYGRKHTTLFPSPGLDMSDSFFGTYARGDDGKLLGGRLYLGIHANGYGSSLTAQVRAYSKALFVPSFIEDPVKRDPWWTFLGFYNSIRELGGAKTLFDSDIGDRLDYLYRREGVPESHRRQFDSTEELTSRLSQADIVKVMDRLNVPYDRDPKRALSSCLASNIIEVGVDIDRLSLMAVTGQPKSTSSYIQISGRVGRRWWDRPGLVMMMYNPNKSRDRSHFEQFHSYHRRLYERVEPTSATPFAISALKRGMSGAVFAWARQRCSDQPNSTTYIRYVEEAADMLKKRCSNLVDNEQDRVRACMLIDQIKDDISSKIMMNPRSWGKSLPDPNGEYLMLWPGVYYSDAQKARGVFVPTSMRQVDTTSELGIPSK